jgi:hypothetical protein
MSDSRFAQLDREAWLAQRLGEHGAGIFTGLTDRDVRRERIRAAIVEHGLEAVIVGRHEGRPETYAQVFERLYGTPLDGNKSQPGDGNKRKSAAPKNSPHSAPSRSNQSPARPAQLSLGDSHP